MAEKSNLDKKSTRIAQLEKKLPLERFIPAAFMVFLLCVITLSIISYQNIEEYKKDVKRINHSQEIMRQNADINTLAYRLTLFRKVYQNTGDNKYRVNYYDSKQKLNEEIENLKKLTIDNSIQQNSIYGLDSLIKKRFAVLDSTVDLYYKEKKIPDTEADITDKIRIDLLDISDYSKKIEDEENKLLNERYAKAEETNSNIQVFIVITSLAAFMVIGLSLFLSNKLIKNKNVAEKLLQKSYDELEDKVEERTLELQTANEKLISEINNRVKVEKALRESEKRFKEMADSAPVLIWMAGVDKLCNYFNKGWLDFRGRTMEQESGNGWAEGVHPDDLQRCLDIYLLSFDKRENFEMEYRLKNFKGEYIWIVDRGVPRYEEEEFAGYIGCCIDIHQRKINERYLRIQYAVSKTLSEAKSFEEASSRVLEDICKTVGWNLGVLWTVDEEKDKLVQSSLWVQKNLAPKEYSEIFDKSVVFEKGIGLPGIVWETGKTRWVQNIENDDKFGRQFAALSAGFKSAFAVPVSNDSVILVIECFNKESLAPREDLLSVLEAVGRQIGNFLERKKAEEKLNEYYAELEERVKERTAELANTLTKLLYEITEKEKIQNKLKLFGHAIKGIKECVYITDLENRVLFINSSFETTYGFYENELIGQDIPVIFSSGVSEQLREEILLNTFRNGYKGELKNKRKDGNEFNIYLSTSAIKNDEGKVEAIVGICQDITEQKKNEELIKKQNILLKLLNDIILVTNKSFDINNSISYALNKICQYTGWEVGHAFLVNKEGDLVSPGVLNFNLNKKYSALKKHLEESTLKNGKGMPGRVLKEAKPFWLKLDEIDKNTYGRMKIFEDSDLKTGIWVPLMKQTEAIGILEFFKKDYEPQDNEILECIANIGVELGSLVERNEILERIKESEKHFKAVADSANDAIITLDKQGDIIYANKSVESIFGYDSLNLTGSNLSKIMPDRFVNNYKNDFKKAAGNNHSGLIGKTVEAIAKKRDGEEFPVEISLAKWEINNSPFFTGMLRDISIRKKIENELIEKQNMLVQAQEIAKLGSWDWNLKTNKVTWSNEMYSIYGIDRETFSGTLEAYKDLIHPDDREMVKNAVEKGRINKEPFSYYHRVITPAGEVKVLKSQGEVYLNPDGEVERLFGTALDITEIKRAEEKITNSERQLREAQQIAKLGSWEINVHDRSLSWSDEMYRIYGFEPGEIEPSFETTTNFVHPDDAHKVEELRNRIRENIKPAEIDFRIITPNAQIKYLHVEILVEYYDNNEPKRLYGSIQDITEIKLVEDELREANTRLMEAQKELVHNEKLAALGRFSSGIAHEIRNPLANISALSQLLSKLELDEKSKKHLKYILINADIANKIIKDLLNFASPEDLVFEYENFNEIINNILESVEPRCTENNVTIIKDIPLNLPHIYIDKIRIENALMNFISNSIDAMPGGGELKVSVSTDKMSENLNIQISDTGMGISQENLDKIFEPFFTTKKDGTGLGLGLAFQTIKSHHGTLDIQSELNKGTVIKITIPIKKISE